MLQANYPSGTSAIVAFRASLTQSDEDRLNTELDTYAKELVSAMLFQTTYDELIQMLKEKEISPLLFQWALAIRDGRNGQECLLES